MAESRIPHPEFPPSDDVDQLLLNARLRDELEPFFDESIARLNLGRLPTSEENDYLASMLAWERAPVVPIASWFEPELSLPAPESLSDNSLHRVLWNTIHKLFEKRIILAFTDHLSDRQLYCLIYRDILTALEKKMDRRRSWLYWDCLDAAVDEDNWLRYYATPEEREGWLESGDPDSLPPSEQAPFPRQLPRPPQ